MHTWLYYEWLYGVHKTCAETAPVSHRICYVPARSSAVSTPLGWIFKIIIKNKNKTTLLFHLTQRKSQGFTWGALTKNTETGASTSILSSSFFFLFLSFFRCCLMSSDVGWHIRDKLRPMPKHGSVLLYVHGNAIRLMRMESPAGRPPRLSHSSWTMILFFPPPTFKKEKERKRKKKKRKEKNQG